MQIRRYRPGEELELWRLFHDTVHLSASADYSPEQLDAWSPTQVDLSKWRSRLGRLAPIVVENERKLIGYADFDTTGLVEHLYVHPQWQRRKVGTLLMQFVHEMARSDRIPKLYADVSITARPFFESWKFAIDHEQSVRLHDVELRGYRMSKTL